MHRRLISCVAVLACLCGGPAAQPALAGGGNSDAAHACQQGGYLNMARSDGSGFKNAGDCVSYAAQGGDFAACVVTPTSGCLVFDNQAFPYDNFSGGPYTVTINGAFSFSTACTGACEEHSAPNALATGAATFTLTDNSTGEVLLQGTLTAANTAGSDEGLGGVAFYNASGPSTCPAATRRSVTIWLTTTLSDGTSVNDAYLGANVYPASSGSGTDTFGSLGSFQLSYPPYYVYGFGSNGTVDQTTVSC